MQFFAKDLEGKKFFRRTTQELLKTLKVGDTVKVLALEAMKAVYLAEAEVIYLRKGVSRDDVDYRFPVEVKFKDEDARNLKDLGFRVRDSKVGKTLHHNCAFPDQERMLGDGFQIVKE